MEEFEVDHSNIYYLKEAPIRKALAHLCIPMMIGISAGTIYNLINAFFIGLVHDTAMLSAITLGLPIFTVLMAIGNVFGVGAGTFVTRLLGEGNLLKGKSVAGYAFYMSVICGLIVSAIALLFVNPIVQLLGADASTLLYTKQYTITLFAGGFAFILNYALEQIVRSEGAAKESMYGMFISVIFSILFDVLFILVLNLHVMGAALSMVLANIAASIYYIWFLDRRSETLRGFLKHWKVSMTDQLEIYKVGVPELFKMSFMIVTTLLLNNYSIEYGKHVVASFGIAVRVAQLPEFVTMGLFIGAISLIAFNFGGKNKSRLYETLKELTLWIGGISIVFASIAYIFKVQVLGLFSSDSAVLSIGALILTAQLISSVFNGFTGLFTSIFQASGEGLATGIMSITQGVLFIPVVIILHHLYGLNGIIWSLTMTEGITFVMGAILMIPYLRKLKKMPYNSTVVQ
ncbi:MATE family efflux transporter [Gottfriedia acidiceleris]|uniref:MATE family efflux transporter n=1 Tax=Gottfriedia acidiceleris TaxID=371036 RepID=UPI000B442A5C|nr:MATE family efflux transporter [Gottfriedia acidiceleris]